MRTLNGRVESDVWCEARPPCTIRSYELVVGLNWVAHASYIGFDHINRNPPVLIRTPKLTRFEPAQYWGGGPPGNSVVLNPSFCFAFW